MDKLFTLSLLALAIYHLVEQAKPLFPETWSKASLILSLVLGLAIAAVTQIDLINLVGLETANPIVGIILTGLGLAGGSNTIFDVIKGRQQAVEVIEEPKEEEAE